MGVGGEGSSRLDDTSRRMFRSDPMKYVQIVIPRDQAHAVTTMLGKQALVQFVDQNQHLSSFQKLFIDKVKLCHELARVIQGLESRLERSGFTPAPFVGSPRSSLVGVTAQADEMSQLTLDFELEDLPDILSKTVSGLDEAISSYDAIAKQVRQFAECRTVVDVCSKYLEGPSRLSGDSDAKQLSEHPSTDTASMIPGSPVASEYIDQRTLERRLSQPLLENERMSSGFRMLSRICGCILTSRRVVMERMLFRATRGNLLSRFIELSDELEDPETGEKVKKVVFILFYSGERIKERTLKILSALNATVYEIPEGKGSQNQMLSDLSRNIEQQADICTRSKDLRDQILADIASSVKRWKYLVFKERITYNEMNKFDTKMSASLIAECWIPAHSFEVLREMLDKLTSYGSDSQALLQELFPPPPSAGDIPTFIETNKFTSVFQGVVDSFGTPDYREFNPGLFTIITFPFLFGIMFGDVGHGSIMTAAAAAFIYYEKRLASSKMNEMVQMMYDGRYIIFLMGLFSVYCGFIYNETFAVPLPWFGHSKWTGVSSEQKTAVLTGVYPFGADPVWAESDAGLPFFNSLKMKMAIIIGVSQMVVGIFLNLLNSVYFRRPLDIIFGFIPQIIFMMSIFGYLCIMICIKWGTDWANDRPKDDPPSLLQMLINMFLASNGPDKVQLYHNQHVVESALKTIAFIMIPLMLIPKPAILWYRNRQKVSYAAHFSPADHGKHEDAHHEFNFGEICTNQLIHTLEFVLGCVSNTASYLRLWALSLAHGQLSKVFWNYFIKGVWGVNPFFVVGGFAVWFGVTIGIIMLLESLSAFLHTLRLHWVEFQNKFYVGSGKPFLPFSYSKLDGI